MTEESRPKRQLPATTATGIYARAFGWLGNRRNRRERETEHEQQLDNEARELHDKLVAMQAEFDKLKAKSEEERGDQSG